MLMLNRAGDADEFRDYEPLPLPPGKFWADPFLVTDHGRTVVFFEEASLASGKGRISAIEIDRKGSVSNAIPVLERDYHLSYPFVFEWQGVHYMIPESAENRTVELYKCRSFPNDWVFEKALMEDVLAYDATLHEYDGLWWMFVNVSAREGASSWDELCLFYASTPIADDWTPQPMNPVISDVRSARPAGRLFEQDGKLIRPSQDSSFRYGYRLNFNEINELSTDKFSESLSHRIEAPRKSRYRGVHTFARSGEHAVIDAIQRFRR